MTTTSEQLLAWDPARGLADAPPVPDGRLLAADSWLIHDGHVRALPRHRERFLRACAETSDLSAGQLSAFWRDMTAALPHAGRWFPRVELVPAGPAGQPGLRFRLRVAPPLSPEVRLWAQGQPDPRTAPRRKGPDLGALAGVRDLAVSRGADEAVLTTDSGVVIEAAHSSILWWEGETLCLPSPELLLLPGVTSGLIEERARRSGIPVDHRFRTVPELDGREVWLVNALHGIRPVTGWTDGQTGAGPMRAGPAMRAAEWRSWLAEMTDPLPLD